MRISDWSSDVCSSDLTQTRRHSFIVSLLGIRSVVLAVNKMDLVDFSEARFREIVNAYRPIAAHLGLPGVTAIPMSARAGDTVIAARTAMPWYDEIGRATCRRRVCKYV